MSRDLTKPRPLEPEVLPRAPEWVDRLAWLMDRSIPIGPWKIGLDGIIGLVPGLGDFAGMIVSGLIVAAAVRARLPRSAIARMVANVALDGIVGAIPFLGDFFDMAFKANTRNVEIYREALRGGGSRTRDSLFVAAVVLAFAALLAIPLLVLFLILRRLAGPG
jgi:hypothetical protein